MSWKIKGLSLLFDCFLIYKLGSDRGESRNRKHCSAVVEDEWEERLQSFATISLYASIVQWNNQGTLESDFLSSKHGRGSYNNCSSPLMVRYIYINIYIYKYIYIYIYILYI